MVGSLVKYSGHLQTGPYSQYGIITECNFDKILVSWETDEGQRSVWYSLPLAYPTEVIVHREDKRR